MAVLVALTLGFLAGSAYTSFKLARVSGTPASQKAPGQTSGSSDDSRVSAQAEAKILELQAHVKKNPDDAKAWVKLGDYYFDMNRAGESIEAYTKALALEPDNPEVLTDLGVMYRRSGQPEKAIKAFDRAVAADPSFETARFNKGVVLMHDLNDISGAVQAWEALVKINPVATAPGGDLVQHLIEKVKQSQSPE